MILTTRNTQPAVVDFNATEILTQQGWTPWFDVAAGQQVLGLGLQNVAAWQPVTRAIDRVFSGDVWHCRTNRLSVQFPSDQYFFTQKTARGRGNQNYYRLWESLPPITHIRRVNSWVGVPVPSPVFVSRVPLPNGGCRVREWKFDATDWCTFLGWFVAEGCCYRERRRKLPERVLVAQRSDPRKIAEIDALLTRMQLKYRYAAGSFEFANGPVARHLRAECGRHAVNKRVPKYIKESTPEQMAAFLDSFCKGDGTFRDGERLSYYTSSPLLGGDLQEMLAKLGRAGLFRVRQFAGSEFFIGDRRVVRKHDNYVLNERRRPSDMTLNKSDFVRIRYVGPHRQFVTPMRSLLTRRHGHVTWLGTN